MYYIEEKLRPESPGPKYYPSYKYVNSSKKWARIVFFT